MCGVGETLCSGCLHLPVCANKEKFLKIQEAVNDIRTDLDIIVKCKWYLPRKPVVIPR